MFRPVLLLLILSLSLPACGFRDSRVNPLNWFGNSRSVPAPTDQEVSTNPLIPTRTGFFQRGRAERNAYQGTPIDAVTDLRIERVPGGAIIRATGVGRVQGLFEVQLTPDGEAVDGVLSYRMEARRPEGARPGGPEATRTVTAARAVTDQDLAGVRVIRVAGIENARTSSRR